MTARLVVALLVVGAAALALTEALPWVAWPVLVVDVAVLGVEALRAGRDIPPVTPADVGGRQRLEEL